ncbi:MAG: ATP-binding protein [Actinomycetota bacterium]|nr:ATP-binding protein [Actinomycetota bacterium]
MDIAALIEIALAGTDRERLAVGAIEPVVVSDEVVAGLASIVSELVHNATESSAEVEKVRVTGSVEPDGYLIALADSGSGVSDQLLDGLNRLLDDPQGLEDRSESASGIYLVAVLAARHGIKVRLVPGAPGVTVRVSVPTRLIEVPAMATPEAEEEARDEDDSLLRAAAPATPPSASNGGDESVPGRGVARSETEKSDTETFLQSVFAPLMDGEAPRSRDMSGGTVEPATEEVRPTAPKKPQPVEPSQTSALQTRVPGENYDEPSEEASHTKAGEAAVEIKLALSDYDRGRQAANAADE